MRRRPAWMPTIAALAAIVLFVMAGNWQHRRMNEKEACSAQSRAALAAAPAPLPADVADWRAWRFRRVIVTGRFDAARQILIDNKVHGGSAGFDVVAPLALADGRVVLVDRGWTPVGRTRATLPDLPPPQGVVTIHGRVDIPAGRLPGTGERRRANGRAVAAPRSGALCRRDRARGIADRRARARRADRRRTSLAIGRFPTRASKRT